ncbi:unnamed protein product [Brassica napus]|uniref:(rape) hypothetical protein n=1 Tax=Brassica napus TaxID=3708 RepID=A0A816KVT9_BRANA|nr:unnamed protein product [Brassica napus]
MALSIWLLLSTVLSTVTRSRLVAISVASSLVVVHAPSQLAVTPVSFVVIVECYKNPETLATLVVCSLHVGKSSSGYK